MCVSRILSGLPFFGWVENKANETVKKINPASIHAKICNSRVIFHVEGVDKEFNRFRIQMKIAIALVATVVLVTLIAALAISAVGIKVVVVLAGIAALIGALATLRYNFKVYDNLKDILNKEYFNGIPKLFSDELYPDKDPATRLYCSETKTRFRTSYEDYHYPITAECYTLISRENYT